MATAQGPRGSRGEGRGNRGKCRFLERSVSSRPKAVSTSAALSRGRRPFPRSLEAEGRFLEARSAVFTFPRGAQRRWHERRNSWQSGGNRGNGPYGPRGNRGEGRCPERSVSPRRAAPFPRSLERSVEDRGNRGRSWQRPKGLVAVGRRVVAIGGNVVSSSAAFPRGRRPFPRAQRCPEAEGRFHVPSRPKAVSSRRVAPFSRSPEARSAVGTSGEIRGNRGETVATALTGLVAIGGKVVAPSVAFPRGAQRRFHVPSSAAWEIVAIGGDRGNGPRASWQSGGESWQSGEMSFPRAQRFLEAEGRFLEAEGRFHERSVVPRPKAVSTFPRGRRPFPRGA
ncbi:hypothetical protein L21SP4_02129 [Kiritimatiella glycovorans]|uniref:Uncharacterized protein n=1 Tax=Kiritimatiella glycovorans TaxID=1307763 RepID=A0A0G3EKT1_9BACT|nr:hypothetical protein L21SP4_02129 [Kiritimatiella glycovorans]